MIKKSNRPACFLQLSLLFLLPGMLHAQSSTAVLQAYERSDYTAVVNTLLPRYRAGTLDNGQLLRILSYSCSNTTGGGSLLGGLLGSRGSTGQCRKEAGRIMLAAAQAGDIAAMNALSLSIGPNNTPVAYADLPQDLSAAHYWAVLGSLLAADPKQSNDFRVLLKGHERFIATDIRAAARKRAETDYAVFAVKVKGMRPKATPSAANCSLPAPTKRGKRNVVIYGSDPRWREIPGSAPSSVNQAGDSCDGYCDNELDTAYLATACIMKSGSITRFDLIDQIGNYQRMEIDCGNGRFRHLLSGSPSGDRILDVGNATPGSRWLEPDSRNLPLQAMVCR